MDREIPSVPITTLAGVASLTDLLPEMPLPSPLPQTLSNKSLLFHPRVAEEAQNLLGTREHALIPQLVASLLQSSTDYIELKDHYASTEQNVDQQQIKPQLLQAILEKNPNVFNNGPQVNATHAVWNHTAVTTIAGQSCTAQSTSVSATTSDTNYLLNSATYGQLSPCGTASRHTPQGSPASPAPARLPGAHRPSVITEQHPQAQNFLYTPVPSSCSPMQTDIASPDRTLHENISTPPQISSQLNYTSSDPSVISATPPASTDLNNPATSSTSSSPSVINPTPATKALRTNFAPVVSSPSDVVLALKSIRPRSSAEHTPSPLAAVRKPPRHSAVDTTAAIRKPVNCVTDTSANNSCSNSVLVQCYSTNTNNSASVKCNEDVLRNTTDNSNSASGNNNNNSATNRTSNSGSGDPEDFEQALPVQRIQTVSAIYTTNNNDSSSLVPSNVTATNYQSTNNSCFAQAGANQPQTNTNHINSPYPYLIGDNLPDSRPRTGVVGCNRQDHMAKPMNIRGPSPAQASDAPAPMSYTSEQQSSFIVDAKQMPVNKDPLAQPQPVVRLNRITQEDQALMQKSISEFAENRPQLANKLGITSSNQCTDESDQDDISIAEIKTRSKATSDSFASLIGFRKRKAPKEPEPVIEVPKPRLRKVERRFVPVLEKLSVEELMETNTYVRFSRSIDKVLDNLPDYNLDRDDDDDLMMESSIVPRCQLQEFCSEAAKLKSLGAMHMIPTERLVKLLNLLEHSIRDGDRISPLTDPDDNEDARQIWMETAMERVMSAVDASLTCMYVMTSTNMSKRVYLEDTIDRVILFVKYQLHNTIFPSFDPVYSIDTKKKSSDNRKRKSHSYGGHQVREKGIVQLYNKIYELVSLLAELLQLQTLTDTTVLHASSMGVAPFFVDNVSELQLSCLKLVTSIFTRYENHRRLLLDDILASIARLPSSKRGLRSYRLLNDKGDIQMLTALVLQLIQCVVALPESLANEKEKNAINESSNKMNVDKDVLFYNKYEVATNTAGTFLTVFLGKCGNKSEEIDYRPLFENFVHDLLTTVNKPEWPASEMLLSLLGTMLVKNFTNKSLDVTLRVASLDYLGVIASRLRKDAVTSTCKLQTIDQMIKDIKSEEIKENDQENSKSKTAKIKFNSEEDERIHFLQRVLLDYLAVNGQKDQAHRYARHFYLVQWYRDTMTEKKSLASGKTSTNNQQKTNSKPKKTASTSDDDSEMDEPLNRLQANANNTDQLNERYRMIDERKKFYVSKIRPFQDNLSAGNRVQVLQTYIDYKSAELIVQYLASKRTFSQSFDIYLKHILNLLRETSIAIRTKAMKSLTMIVEADSSVLARNDMQRYVNHSFLDHSTSVREAAVDLVGKFVLSRPELIDKYYNMLLARILDTGVSVRKRVIKILKDICIECPQFDKIPEICVKMIRRVNDEEGIRKLVMEVFQNMWFTPTRVECRDILIRKVMNIIDVVASSKEVGIEWFEMLLISLFKPREDKDDSTKIVTEPPKSLLTACKQIVDCLIENTLRLDEGNASGTERLVACLTTLYLLAKIRPQLLVKHASTLQPYLSYKCQTKIDHQIVSYVAQTLELVVPLIEHPSETFLAQLEEDSIKLILQGERSVVASCIACLGSIVNNVTRNFKLIRDCFNKYHGYLITYKKLMDANSPLILDPKRQALFRRAMFTVGLLLRHFDFTDHNVTGNLPNNIKDQVFDILTFFLNLEDRIIQLYTLKAIGYICVRHSDFMLMDGLKQFYHQILTDPDAALEMKSEVLRNIEMYLLEEESRMIKQDKEWSKRSKDENLKEMGDVSSGMASTVIQLYLKEILQEFLHPNITVRISAVKVIQLILQQGLVHPVQIVPYLICMSTDVEKIVSNSADKQLQTIEKTYPGFIHMRAQMGIRLSYQLQRIIQNDDIVRGYRVKEKGEYPGALNGFLYSILRNTKQQRRAIVNSILKQFDEHVRTTLAYMLYLADNLAYFPYQVQDEPLFIIHHIDLKISVSGTNLLQSFREALLPINGLPPPTSALASTLVPQDPLAMEFSDPTNKNSQNENTIEGQEQQQPSGNDSNSMITTEQPILPAPAPPPIPPPPPSLRTAVNTIIDDDDEETEADIMARLPEDTQPLQSCITAAQGCLLLLVLKQHLKDVYGISDSKISKYSPNESAKIYEKAVNRKGMPIFNPKATLNRLKEGSPSTQLDEAGRKDLVSQYLDFKQLMLKLDPDEDDDDDDNQTKNTTTTSNVNVNTTDSSNLQSGNKTPAVDPSQKPITDHHNTRLSSQYTSGTITNDVQATTIQTPIIDLIKENPPRVPKLVISNRRPITTVDLTQDNSRSRSSRSHRASDKPKKHRQKRRRKKVSTSSGEDSENDYSDPDFLV